MGCCSGNRNKRDLDSFASDTDPRRSPRSHFRLLPLQTRLWCRIACSPIASGDCEQRVHNQSIPSTAMPPPATLPYKRPFFSMTLSPNEIEEDLALIITNTKRRRRNSPSADHRSRMDRD